VSVGALGGVFGFQNLPLRPSLRSEAEPKRGATLTAFYHDTERESLTVFAVECVDGGETGGTGRWG